MPFEKGPKAAEYLSIVLSNHANYVITSEKINAIKQDFSDNIFLEAAVERKADFIISRDNDMLNLKEIRGIRIITAEETARRLRRSAHTSD